MTSIRQALAEIQRFTRGVLPKLVLAALLCIPLLYGGVYLYSNWDPYGKTDRVTGELVMQDQGGTTNAGKHQNVGSGVADQLHSADSFDWKDQTSRTQALQDVSDGTADFAIVIPADFTQKLLSTSRFSQTHDGKTGTVDPQKAGLEIVTNDANNYVLTNIVKTAGTTVRDSVAQQVGETTASTMLASLTDIHGKLSQATSGSQKVTDGTINLSSALAQLKSGTSSLASGAQQLDSGAQKLLTAQGKLVDANQSALAGAQKLDSGAQSLSSGATTLAQGTGTLASGADQLSTGAQTLSQGASALATGTQTLSSGASQLATGTGTLSSGAARLAAGTKKLDTSLQQSGLADLATGLNQVCRDLSAATSSASSGTSTQQASAAQSAVTSRVHDAVQQSTSTQLDALVSEGVLTKEQAAKAAARLNSQQAQQQVAQAAQQATTDLQKTAAQAAQKAGTSLKALQQSSCAADGTSVAAQKISSLTSSVAALDTGAAQVASGAAAADTAAQKLATGAQTVQSSTQKLATGAGTLATKTGQLATGAHTVDSGAKSLASGSKTLASGTSSLAQGAAQLLEGQQQAQSGTAELAQGTGQAVSGSKTLDEGTGKAASGSQQLESGSRKLTSSLASGRDQVPSLSKDQQSSLAAVMSDAVESQHSSLAGGSVYGEGMGPFFIVLALWIGVLMAGQFLRASSTRALASNASGLRIALGAWLPFAVVGVGQAVVLYLVVRFALGFDFAHPWLVLAFLLLVSVTFTALGQGLISLAGAPGKLLVLVLLILQLVTSGGLMPYETLPDSLRWMHHVLPMGYALTGVRRLAYGIDVDSLWGISALMLGYLLLGLAFGYLGARLARTWKLSRLDPEVAL